MQREEELAVICSGWAPSQRHGLILPLEAIMSAIAVWCCHVRFPRARRGTGGDPGGMTRLEVRPIDPARIAMMRGRGADEHGNAWRPYAAAGWEPLRCCLRKARDGERIVLISYQPLSGPSPWAEAGPVYVHADVCSGYPEPGRLPVGLLKSARVLRSYDAEGRLLYDRMARVDGPEECERELKQLLAHDEVDVVHVRAALSQCFTFEVRRAAD